MHFISSYKYTHVRKKTNRIKIHKINRLQCLNQVCFKDSRHGQKSTIL